VDASTTAEQQFAKLDPQLFSLGGKRTSLRMTLKCADSGQQPFIPAACGGSSPLLA